jgi:hypothetical protein
MLNVKTVRDRLLQAPFKPFTMRSTDGRKILIDHPEFVAVGGGVVLVTDLDDNVRRVDSLHIASLDDVPEKKRNGKHSR